MDPFSGGSNRDARRGASGAGLSSRKKLLLVAGSLLVLVVLVIVYVSSGAPDDGRYQAGTDASGDRSSQGNDQGGGPGAGEGSPSEESEDKPSEDDSSSDPGPESSGSEDAVDSAPSGSDSADSSDSAEEGPIPERAQDPDVAPQPGEEVQSSHDGGEQAYVRAPEGGESSSASAHENQPGSYDPLGRGAESDGLTGREEERARFAASSYVTYAYGYTGDDISEYHNGLFGTMFEGEFQKSPGRADIQAVEDDIKDGGLQSAAVLDEFDIQEPGQDEIKGIAYFTVGESYDGGGVSGDTTSYAQPLNLQRSTTGWTVVAADEREEV